MLLSKLLGERFKEKPAEAFMSSHIFMLRGGYIRQVANGIFSLLPPALRAAKKIEQIIREEMDAIGGQEVLFPVVLPAELWQESGRFDTVGRELLRFKDRGDRDMVLGMTHEEAAVHLARGEAKSYLKYPFMIYQIQTKFRDEPRARGGLIRVREFIMKDAYSFHTSQEDLDDYYQKTLEAYFRIFERCGLSRVISILSDTGMMGGKKAHEFMYLSDGGEDTIVYCGNCDYKSNMEVAVSHIHKTEAEEQELKEVYTPGIQDIESLARFLNIDESQTMKAAVFFRKDNEKPVLVFIRGDLEVNELKLSKVLGTEAFPLTDHDIVDLAYGYIGAYNLNAEEKDIQVIYDQSLKGEKNLACGANKVDYHLQGLSVDRDLQINEFVDVAKVREGDSCVKCGSPLKISRGIEVGNIFQLGTTYTESMNMHYMDEHGKLQTPIMGCYGIGVGRLLACVIEDNHDEYGPIWPKAVAPWLIHICMLNTSDVGDLGYKIYNELKTEWDVILDDRGVQAGVQFADADLLGAPVRIILSKRNIAAGQVEIVSRDKKIKKLVPIEDVKKEVREVLAQVK
ncbi:MAG: proline--tRNA ligase [Caldicoprobacterales bacterium]|jgi:prolyl-tRNA synthetase